MKKALFIAAFSFLFALTLAAQDKNVSETGNAAADNIVKLIQSGLWKFTPWEVELPSSVRVADLLEDRNYIMVQGNRMKIMADFSGGRVEYATNPNQARRTAVAVARNPSLQASIPGLYMAVGKIVNLEVAPDKKCKNVDVEVDFEIEESNSIENDKVHHMKMSISVKNLNTRIYFSGLHCDETLYGKIRPLAIKVESN